MEEQAVPGAIVGDKTHLVKHAGYGETNCGMEVESHTTVVGEVDCGYCNRGKNAPKKKKKDEDDE